MSQNKKRGIAAESIVVIILMIIVFIILLTLTLTTGEWIRAVSNKQTCFISSTVSDFLGKIGISTGIRCQTHYLQCLAPKENDQIINTNSDPTSTGVTSEDMFTFTKEVYGCYDQFGRGRVNIVPGGALDSDTTCFVCTRFIYNKCNEKETDPLKESDYLTQDSFVQSLQEIKSGDVKGIDDISIVLNGFPQDQNETQPIAPFVKSAYRKYLSAKDFNIGAVPEWTEQKIVDKLREKKADRYNEMNVNETFPNLEQGHEYAIVYWIVPAEKYQESISLLGDFFPLGEAWITGFVKSTNILSTEPQAHVIITDVDDLDKLGCDHIYSN